MGLFDSLFGTQAKTEKLDTMSPEQKQVFSQLMGFLGGGQGGGQGGGLQQTFAQMMQMLDPSSSAYQKFEQPYLDQFNQQTIPGLAERFAGAGGGALSSSGFGQALSSAGAGLQTDLAGMKSQLQQQTLQDILNLMGQGLGKETFQYQHTPASKGLLQSGLEAWAGGGLPGIGQGMSPLSGLFSKPNQGGFATSGNKGFRF